MFFFFFLSVSSDFKCLGLKILGDRESLINVFNSVTISEFFLFKFDITLVFGRTFMNLVHVVDSMLIYEILFLFGKNTVVDIFNHGMSISEGGSSDHISMSKKKKRLQVLLVMVCQNEAWHICFNFSLKKKII